MILICIPKPATYVLGKDAATVNSVMSSPRQAGHRVRDAIAVFEQNKGKIVFSEDKNRKLYPKDRPLRPLLRDNIYIQDDLKYRRSTGNESPSPPLVKGAVVKRITYSSPPRYQLDCKEDSSPSSPTSRQTGAWRDRDVTTVNNVPLSSVSMSVEQFLALLCCSSIVATEWCRVKYCKMALLSQVCVMCARQPVYQVMYTTSNIIRV